MSAAKSWEVIASGVVVGAPDKALLLSWSERGTLTWVVDKQVEPGLWTNSAGARDARTEFVTLRRAQPRVG